MSRRRSSSSYSNKSKSTSSSSGSESSNSELSNLSDLEGGTQQNTPRYLDGTESLGGNTNHDEPVFVLGSPKSISGKLMSNFTKTYGCGDL